MRRFTVLVSLWVAVQGLLVASSFAETRVLIVPKKPKDANAAAPESSLASYLAQELSQDGRVKPIVWGLSDPTFREAALQGKISESIDVPTPAEAVKAAKVLGVTYLVFYDGRTDKQQLEASAELVAVSGGRKSWTDQRTVGQITAGRYDRLGSAASIARTWSVMLIDGPFRTLTKPVKVETPVADPGQAAPIQTPDGGTPKNTTPQNNPPKNPTQPNANPIKPPVTNPTVTPKDTTPPKPAEKVDLAKRVESLRRPGYDAQAVTFLRDQVYLNPLDPEPRRRLIELLVDLGEIKSAAAEARRASELLPNSPEFRRLAIQSLIQTNQLDEAREAVNAMLAREGARPEILTLAAEVDLRALRIEAALSDLDRAIQTEPTGERYYLRAIVRALLGGEDGLKRDFEVSRQRETTLPEEEIRRRYRIALGTFYSSVTATLKSLPSFIQKLSVRPKDPDLRAEWERYRRECESRTAFLALTYGANHHRKSHDGLVLAHQLLKLSLLDLASLMDGNEESVTDARINLGEALKQATAAQKQFQIEVSGVTDNAVSS